MEHLKLIAFDVDDLAVISAHLQEATLTVGDLVYAPHQKRFAAIVSRQDWAALANSDAGSKSIDRCQTILRLERVLGASTTGIDLQNKSEPLSLLTLRFDPKTAGDPEGNVTLFFANGAAIRLHVECVEAELRDLGLTGALSTARHDAGN